MKSSVLYTMMAFLIILLGCSGGNNSPLTPGINQGSQTSVGVSNLLSDGNPSGGSGLIGIYEISVDKGAMTAEMTSLRSSSAIDTLEVVDITGFMSVSPCKDCAKIRSVGVDTNGNVVLSIGIKHPFAAGDPANQITGKNRADLHIFNVEGVMVLQGAGSQVNFSGLAQTVNNGGLLNPDGFTPYLDLYLDQAFPTSETIHPYILHFKDYSTGNFSATNPMGFASVTNPPPSGNLVMPMGVDYDFQDYILAIGEGNSANFYYAVECTYAITTNNFLERFNPVYRVPQHNKKAASEVDVEITHNNLAAGVLSSAAEITVKVLDINHGVSVGPGLDQMYADSSVKAISAEVSGVTSSPVVVNNPVAVGGNGRNPSDPLRFNIQIPNSANASEGTYTGLIKVLDSYQPGINTAPALTGYDGVKRVPPGTSTLDGLFTIPEFATYQVFTINVAAQLTDPAVTVHAVPTSGAPPLQVQFTVDVVPAPSTTISGYHWTFGDGSESFVEAPLHTYNGSGIFTATCVVTDSNLNTGQDSIQISVNAPPSVTVHAVPTSGDAPLQVQFTVDVVLTPGATVDSYHWTFGDSSESFVEAPLYTYTGAGLFTATCIVTDSNLNTGQDTIQITVNEPPVPTYVGSSACNTCHSAVYTQWEDHGHHYAMTKINGTAPTFPFSSVPNPPPGSSWSNTPYVIGGYAFKTNFLDASGYIKTGSQAQYNLATSAFVPYNQLTPSPEFNCGVCHTTGWQSFGDNGGLHQDNLPGIMGTWTEEGIGCERCHGIGGAHINDPVGNQMTLDPSAASCGECHSRSVNTKVYASGNLILDQQQYNEFMASPHSANNCGMCHNQHSSSVYDSQATGTGIISACTDCHAAATHTVGLGMGSLKCTDCHMPYATKAAVSSGSGVHITGDIPSHIWSIDTSGTTLANYFTTVGSETWITPGVNDKVKLNIAYACMQCHDGVHQSAITSYTDAAGWATGIHN
jgi:PKD repeat protein